MRLSLNCFYLFTSPIAHCPSPHCASTRSGGRSEGGGVETGRKSQDTGARRMVVRGFSVLFSARASGGIDPQPHPVAPQTLVTTRLMPSSVTVDRHVAAVAGLRAGDDVMIVTLAKGQSRTEPWRRTPHNEWWPEFSPDGRWLAYASDESGRFEVYVEPYPGKGARELVSMEGGWSPAWHRSGSGAYCRSSSTASLRSRHGRNSSAAVCVTVSRLTSSCPMPHARTRPINVDPGAGP